MSESLQSSHIKKGKISDLTPDDKNLNRGTLRGEAMLEHSLRDYGAGRSILLDKNNRIIAGNKTTEQAYSIGLDDVLIVETDGKQLVAVKRTDIDLDSKAGRELAIADNRTSEVSLEWDAAALADIAEFADVTKFFDEDEVDAILAELGGSSEPADDPGPQLDRAEELREKWQTSLGQLWQIGQHRLLCGDALNADNLNRLVGGESVKLVWSDPPYGMNLDTDYSGISGGWTGQISYSKSKRYDKVIGDDEEYDPRPLLDYFKSVREIYLWGGDYFADKLPKGGSWIVWDKTGGHTQETVGSEFELCWSKQKHRRIILSVKWAGVIGLSSQDLKSRVHPTQKPLEICSPFIEQYTEEGDIVWDGYAGSGVAFVAAQKLGRIAFGSELDPNYVGVILERLSTMGLEPKLL